LFSWIYWVFIFDRIVQILAIYLTADLEINGAIFQNSSAIEAPTISRLLQQLLVGVLVELRLSVIAVVGAIGPAVAERLR
jgi:hypothetical protein